jgi:hypothetical protein
MIFASVDQSMKGNHTDTQKGLPNNIIAAVSSNGMNLTILIF